MLRLYMPVILIVIIDQFSKYWIKTTFTIFESKNIIGSFLKFSYVNNPGIAFGIDVGNWVMLIVILSFFATFFISYIHWQEKDNHFVVVSGVSFILGGAIGSWIASSSIFFVENYRGVVDFIDIGFGYYRWYTFNVADSAVTIGIIFYLIHSLFNKKFISLNAND